MPVGIYGADPGTLSIDDNGNHKDLRVDSLDKYTCVRLSVAILSSVALLSLVLRDDNLLVSALLYDLTGYSSLYITSYDTLVIRYCKYFIESNLAASLTFSTKISSSTETLYCLPPVLITAYIFVPPVLPVSLLKPRQRRKKAWKKVKKMLTLN